MKKRGHNSTDRVEYIDIAKGILIVLVVIGHITNVPHILTYGVKAVITTFHMPAFFVISGILVQPNVIRNTPFKIFLLKKGYRLILPYLFFEVTGGLWQMLIMGTDNVNLTGILYGILTIHCHIGADWFLPTMYFAELCMFFLLKVRVQKAYPIVSAGCFLIAFMLPDVTYLVACCRRVLIALAFILLGVFFKEYFAKKHALALVISGIVTIVVAYLNGVIDLATRQFGNPFHYVLGSIVGTYGVLCFSQYASGILARILSRIGRSSLVVMGTHQNVQVAFNLYFGSVYSVPLQCVIFITTLFYEIVTVGLYEKCIPFLVGMQHRTTKK